MCKNNMVFTLLGASIVVFGNGICILLLPIMNAHIQGLFLSGVGLALMLLTKKIWSKMKREEIEQTVRKAVLVIVFSLIAAFSIGVGVYLMLWGGMFESAILCFGGVLFLLCLIPLFRSKL